MVEMNETASILNNLSDRSLVLISMKSGEEQVPTMGSPLHGLLQSIFISIRSQELNFIRHYYHELNEMAAQMERIKNFNVSIKEDRS